MYLEQLLTFKIDKINLAWRDGSISSSPVMEHKTKFCQCCISNCPGPSLV